MLVLLSLSFQFSKAEDAGSTILIEFGIANMEAVECTSCWPNGIITRFGQAVSIQKQESGKTIHISLLPEEIGERSRLTITPLAKNKDGEVVELEGFVLDFIENEIRIYEYKGFDLTFSIEPYERKRQSQTALRTP